MKIQFLNCKKFGHIQNCCWYKNSLEMYAKVAENDNISPETLYLADSGVENEIKSE